MVFPSLGMIRGDFFISCIELANARSWNRLYFNERQSIFLSIIYMALLLLIERSTSTVKSIDILLKARDSYQIVIKMTIIQARLAQSVERQALNLVVEGSSPSVGDSFSQFLFSHHFHIFKMVFLSRFLSEESESRFREVVSTGTLIIVGIYLTFHG